MHTSIMRQHQITGYISTSQRNLKESPFYLLLIEWIPILACQQMLILFALKLGTQFKLGYQSMCSKYWLEDALSFYNL